MSTQKHITALLYVSWDTAYARGLPGGTLAPSEVSRSACSFHRPATKIVASSSACNSSDKMVLLGAANNIIAVFAICLFTPAAALALSLDLPGAYFKSGRPIEGETLRDALDPAHAVESLNNLKITAGRLAKYSGTHFDVAGHADPNECEGSECRYLSSRRAQLVFRHLLKLGVDPMRLDGLAGWGTSALISEPRPEDTWRNRRVDINVSN